MKKINARLDSIMSPLNSIAPWFFRMALGVAMFLHGYNKLPAPYMMEEQHRMVTWFESIFIPMPEVCLIYTSPSPRDRTRSRMPSSA